MHTTLLMVSSLNGKITNGVSQNEPTWSSKEDVALFTKLKNTYSLLVMGQKTYTQNKKSMTLQASVLRVVLTKNPSFYAKEEIAGQLEFINKTPKELVTYLETRGFSRMLLLGGAETNTLFFRDHCIDELHLTIEPYLFGSGKNIINEDDLSVRLNCIKLEKINDAGTLHAIYKVLKP